MLTLEPKTRTVRIDARVVSLSEIEYAIFERLVQARGDVVSEADLIRHAYGGRHKASSEALRQRIFALRGKLGRGYVRSLYGHGYYLAIRFKEERNQDNGV